MGVYHYPITQNFIPGLPQFPYRNGVGAYEGVVIHYTCNEQDTAVGEESYESRTFNDAFVQFFIDANGIIQCASTDYLCYGCGGQGNPRYAQIEMCHADTQDEFDAIFDMTCELTADLLAKRQLGVVPAKADGTGSLWSHQDVTKFLGGTDHTDPIDWLNRWGKSWQDLIDRVTIYYNGLVEEYSANNPQPKPIPQPVPNPAPTITMTPIIGQSKATLAQMVGYVRKINPNFDWNIAQAFLTVGAIFGIKGDIAFCQSIHETDWFRFGGDVKASQNNFAGIGATGGVPGNTFASIHDGVEAQLEHLFAYATNSPLPNGEPKLDPRFDLVNRGAFPNLEQLGGHWATPGYDTAKYKSLQDALNANDTYGQNIIKLYNDMLAYTPLKDIDNCDAKDAIYDLFVKGIVTGDENQNYNPEQPATRAEVAAMLDRVLKYIGK